MIARPIPLAETDWEMPAPSSETHKVDVYTGTVKQYGIDIGYQKKGVILWAVLARVLGPRRRDP